MKTGISEKARVGGVVEKFGKLMGIPVEMIY